MIYRIVEIGLYRLKVVFLVGSINGMSIVFGVYSLIIWVVYWINGFGVKMVLFLMNMVCGVFLCLFRNLLRCDELWFWGGFEWVIYYNVNVVGLLWLVFS